MYKQAVDAHTNRPSTLVIRASILSSLGQRGSERRYLFFIRISSKRYRRNSDTSFLLVAELMSRGYRRTFGWDPNASWMSDSSRLTTITRIKEGRSEDSACSKIWRSLSPHSSNPSI